MTTTEDGVRRQTIVLAAALLVACVCYLLAVHVLGIETEVMRDRFWLNAEPMFRGEVPESEYPPLALVFIAIPRLFADTPFGYNVAYVAMMYLFVVAGLLLTSRLASSLGRSPGRAMLAYTVLTLLMLEFVLDRFDMIPAVMTLGALCLYTSGRIPWAFVLLALGTLTKLYPAILIPVLLLHLLGGRRWADAAKGFAAFAGTGLAAVAVCWTVDPALITGFMGYHGDRPLQLESVASSVIYALSMAGLTDVWIQSATEPGSFLSDNLRGPLPDAVADALMPLLAMALVALCALYMLVVRGRGRDDAAGLTAVAMLACLMAFLVVNKVFSTQYIIWLIPSVLLVCMVVDREMARRLLVAAVVMILLSQLNFAYNIGYLGGGANIGDLGMTVILLRNAVAVALLAMCVGSLAAPLREGRPGMLSRIRRAQGNE